MNWRICEEKTSRKIANCQETEELQWISDVEAFGFIITAFCCGGLRHFVLRQKHESKIAINKKNCGNKVGVRDAKSEEIEAFGPSLDSKR